MQNTMQMIYKTFLLGVKVCYLYIKGRKVTSIDIGNSYQKVSQDYHHYYLSTMHQYNERLLDHLVSHVSKGKILDLAGGTGFNASYIMNKGKYDIDLVDISQDMLNQCRDPLIHKICENMLIYLKTCEEERYDALICTWALMYENPQKVLKECYRVLKKKGYLYILVNDRQTLPQVRKVYPLLLIEYVKHIQKLMMELPTPRHQKQLHQWNKNAGFKTLLCQEKKQDFLFDYWEDAATFVTSTGALAGYDVMIDLRDKDIFESFVKRLELTSNKPCITHHFIEGIAIKENLYE